MTCKKYADYLDNEMFFDDLCQEQALEGRFNAGQFFTKMLDKASDEMINLSDKASWDYYKYFYNLYENTEK